MRDQLSAIGVELREETGRATALPASAQGVAAVVDLARDEGWVVTPHWAGLRGSGSVLHLSPERLCEIEEVVPADLMAVVGAGVTVAALEERVAADGLCWPPASFCAPNDMIGDIIARLPGGWTMEGNLARRYLLALAAVLADGWRRWPIARRFSSATDGTSRGWRPWLVRVSPGGRMRAAARAHARAVAKEWPRPAAARLRPPVAWTARSSCSNASNKSSIPTACSLV
jgi:FAD/FMN-containing dehydrogenase